MLKKQITVIVSEGKPHIKDAFDRIKTIKMLGPEFVEFARQHCDIEDIHSLRAMYQYDKAYDAVSKEERQFMKQANFAEMYCVSTSWLDVAMRAAAEERVD